MCTIYQAQMLPRDMSNYHSGRSLRQPGQRTSSDGVPAITAHRIVVARGQVFLSLYLQAARREDNHSLGGEWRVRPSELEEHFFSLEWPPKSGRIQDYPEVDRAGWFNVAWAMRKILKGQAPILQALRSRLEKAR
jgi:hypothetical protein